MRWAGRLGAAARTPWGRSLAVLWVAQVVAEVAFSFALPFIPLYVRDLGSMSVSEAGLWAGAMSGGFSLSMAAMAPVWGWVADRYGRRLMVQRAIFGAGVAIGVMALVQTPHQLAVLRVIQGAFTGVVAATTTMVSLLVPRKHLASALGLMHAALFTGSAIGPVLGGLFSDSFGYRASFGATSAIFLTAGLLVTLLVAEPPRAPAGSDSEADSRGEVPASGSRPGIQGTPGTAEGTWRLLGSQMLAVVGVMGVIRFGNNAPSPVLPLFVEGLGEDPARLATTVGIVVAATSAASTLSALLLGRVADRYGRLLTLLACLLAAAVLSPLHVMAQSVWQLLALRIALGLALGGMVPSIQALLTDLTPPSRRGAAFGLLATTSALGMGAGPVVGSAVAAVWGIPAVFIVSAPVFLVSAMTVLSLRSVDRAARAA